MKNSNLGRATAAASFLIAVSGGNAWALGGPACAEVFGAGAAPGAIVYNRNRVEPSLDQTRKFNSDGKAKGIFAEFAGSGEGARNFFRGLQASKTIERAISGDPDGHTVQDIIETQMGELLKTTPQDRPLFVVADTIVERGDGTHITQLGIRFQLDANGPMSEVVLDLDLRDGNKLEKQDALGKLLSNLTYAVYYELSGAEQFTQGLTTDLRSGQIRVLRAETSGPAFSRLGPLEGGLQKAFPNTEDVETPETPVRGQQSQLQARGIFAEIGAAQEGARAFRMAGEGDAVIEAISEYGKDFSTRSYGEVPRFVSEDRLRQMLDELQRKLDQQPGSRPLFALADTVATKEGEGGMGWLGLRFQETPKGPFNDIVLHVRMLDGKVLTQQESLGALVKSLVEASYQHPNDLTQIISTLRQTISPDQLEVDTVHFSGPAFHSVESGRVGQALMKSGLARTLLFDGNGSMVSPYEGLYRKPVLAFHYDRNWTPSVEEQVIDRLTHEPGVEASNEVILEVRDRNQLPIHVPSGNPYWILISRHMDDAATGDLLSKLGAISER